MTSSPLLTVSLISVMAAPSFLLLGLGPWSRNGPSSSHIPRHLYQQIFWIFLKTFQSQPVLITSAAASLVPVPVPVCPLGCILAEAPYLLSGLPASLPRALFLTEQH